MSTADRPLGIGGIIWTPRAPVFAIGSFFLGFLSVAWLYESKKSLAEISTTLKELEAGTAAGKSSMENEHE